MPRPRGKRPYLTPAQCRTLLRLRDHQLCQLRPGEREQLSFQLRLDMVALETRISAKPVSLLWRSWHWITLAWDGFTLGVFVVTTISILMAIAPYVQPDAPNADMNLTFPELLKSGRINASAQRDWCLSLVGILISYFGRASAHLKHRELERQRVRDQGHLVLMERIQRRLSRVNCP